MATKPKAWIVTVVASVDVMLEDGTSVGRFRTEIPISIDHRARGRVEVPFLVRLPLDLGGTRVRIDATA